MGVSPMEQQEYSFTIAFSSYLLRGLGDGRPQPAEHQYSSSTMYCTARLTVFKLDEDSTQLDCNTTMAMYVQVLCLYLGLQTTASTTTMVAHVVSSNSYCYK
jgi:hypothetical protein